MSTASATEAAEGSWTPTVIILLLVLTWWIATGKGDFPTKTRRWLNLQRITIKQQLGMRDDSLYRNFNAGDGANQKYKRQG
mmetsp:Transcript_2795/g.7751  ORF Transcript_2795/g.7751 Transcript_2795/m.7751 type:complete len:81 (-) Transcript_2795:1179-1421(-)